jgi:hypothetical protein
MANDMTSLFTKYAAGDISKQQLVTTLKGVQSRRASDNELANALSSDDKKNPNDPRMQNVNFDIKDSNGKYYGSVTGLADAMRLARRIERELGMEPGTLEPVEQVSEDISRIRKLAGLR